MTTAALSSGIELEYDTFGSADDPALLLVMGFTAQMTAWEEAFCQLLADGGRFVIRFDNRDCGLSTKLDGQLVDAIAVMVAVMSKSELPEVPYTLSDMAADAIGLLDHLGIGAGPRRRRLDGRDDRADDGDRASRASAQRDLDHVDDRRPRVRPGDPRGDGGDPGAATGGPRRGDRRWRRATACGPRSATSTPTEPAELAAAAYDRSSYPEGATASARGDLRQRRSLAVAAPTSRSRCSSSTGSTTR